MAADVDVVLLLSSRTSALVIALDELESCAKRNARMRQVLVTTRPEPTAAWPGLVGRITAVSLRMAVPDFMRRTVFCCGPESFMSSMRTLLLAGGLPAKTYHQGRFGSDQLGSGSGTRGAATIQATP